MAQQVDYAALAAQARRGAAAPAPVDYAALAEQARQSERRTTPPPAAAMRGMLSPSTPEGGNALPTPDELLRQWATGGPGRMATGVREIVTGSPLRGSADVLTGLGTTLAPVALPALGYAAVTAPVLTGIGLASSYVVGQAGRDGGAGLRGFDGDGEEAHLVDRRERRAAVVHFEQAADGLAGTLPRLV